MQIEVDQSVKIEQSGDSVLAISNNEWKAVVISGRVKTKLQSLLRERKLEKQRTQLVRLIDTQPKSRVKGSLPV